MRHLVVAAALLVALTSPSAAGELSASDRQRLVAHLEMTEAWLASELHGLSPAQLTFKMTPESWSIMDVVEHLAIAEPQYWQKLRDSMKQPPTTEKMEATDAAILWYGIDRTNRARTGEARVPHGTFKDIAGSFGAFRTLRAEMTVLREDDHRRHARAEASRREHGRLPVVRHDLVALAAAHPADSRDQGTRGLP